MTLVCKQVFASTLPCALACTLSGYLAAGDAKSGALAGLAGLVAAAALRYFKFPKTTCSFMGGFVSAATAFYFTHSLSTTAALFISSQLANQWTGISLENLQKKNVTTLKFTMITLVISTVLGTVSGGGARFVSWASRSL